MIWISGPPRSGTTMLNFIVAGDEYLPECTIITELVRLYSVCMNDDDQRFKTFMGEGDELKKKFSAILRTALSGIPENAVLKDPNICLYLSAWRELFPADRMIIIIRDPRDTVSSMLQVLRKTNQKATVRQAIEVVAPHYFEVDRAALRTEKLIMVRYEDVSSLDTGTMRLLSEFVNRQLSTAREITYNFNSNDPFYSPLYGKPVVNEQVGSYKTRLTQAETREIMDVFSGIISRFFADRLF